MSKVFLHPSTELFVKSIKQDPPQSLLLSGPSGVGLLTVARAIAAPSTPLLVRPDATKTTPIISVETIRELYTQSRTKTREHRVVIIDDADKMSLGAQAAFLKLLEEPNASTYFILTAHTPTQLLPTIRSRVQQLSVQPISLAQSEALLDSYTITDPTKRMQLLFLASGLPAELARLAENPEYFQSKASLISDARTLITAVPYQKLQLIQRYRNDRDEALRLIDSTIAVLRHTLQLKPQESLITQLANLVEAREKITGYQNIALHLAQAVL